MYLLLIYTLIFSILTMGFCGRLLGVKGIIYVANCFMFIVFILSCAVFYETSLSASVVICKLGVWFDSETFCLNWGFLFDSITTTMLLIVTFISLLVHLFLLVI